MLLFTLRLRVSGQWHVATLLIPERVRSPCDQSGANMYTDPLLRTRTDAHTNTPVRLVNGRRSDTRRRIVSEHSCTSRLYVLIRTATKMKSTNVLMQLVAMVAIIHCCHGVWKYDSFTRAYIDVLQTKRKSYLFFIRLIRSSYTLTLIYEHAVLSIQNVVSS